MCRCDNPEDPDNGSVDHQYENAGGDHPDVPFVPGVTIHYECDRGYGIKGATADNKAYERVCYADGKESTIYTIGYHLNFVFFFFFF